MPCAASRSVTSAKERQWARRALVMAASAAAGAVNRSRPSSCRIEPYPEK
ncbi:MAG: hypothetical protein L6Q76_11815 [Polyangiaceae bacterium]|nr:hypothetical protein [Polyangiaceae bacterium]